MKKIIAAAAVAVISFSVCAAAFAQQYKAEGSRYSVQREFTEERYSSYIDDSLILRTGNNRALADGYRRNMDTEYQYVMPCRLAEETYIPIKFSLEHLGCEVKKRDDNSLEINAITAEANKPFNGGKNVVSRYGVLYAAAEDIAKFTGFNIYDDGVLVILSPNKTINNPDEKIINELKAALEWRASKMYFGDEGFILGIQIHPKNPDIMYARTDVGGCYRWQPETQTWTQLLNVIPRADHELISVLSLMPDPNDTEVVYALVGWGYTNPKTGLLKSYDRGNSWENVLSVPVHGNVATRVSGERIAIDPNNSDIVYVGTQNDGLLVSRDGGKTWMQNTAVAKGYNGHGVNIIMFDGRYKNDEGNTSLIYASVAGKGLYVSEDAGETFKLIKDTPQYPTRIKLVGNTLYVAANARKAIGTPADGGGLWKYNSGRWTDITPPLNNIKEGRQGIGAFLVDYTNHDFILASGESWTNNDYERYRSYDGGKTWECIRTDMGWNLAELVQDPKNPKRALMADGAGLIAIKDIYKKLNGSGDMLECEYQERGMEELVCLKVMSVPHKDAPKLLLSCYDRGFMIAEDPYHRGISQSAEQNMDIGWATDMDYCNQDPSFVARLGRNSTGNNIALSDDYGRMAKISDAWDRGNACISIALSATVQKNGYPVIIAGGAKQNGVQGSLYRSKDWGKTWEELDGVKSDASSETWSRYWEYILVSDTVDGKTFYYCENSDFYVTKDAGETWSKTVSFKTLDNSFGNPSMAAVPGHEGEVFVRGGGKLWRSTDFGKTWSKIAGVSFDGRSHFAFGKGKQGSNYPALYVTALINGTRGVYISDDMGKSFRRIDDDSQSYTIGQEDGIAGDMNVYGRVYVSTANTGVTYYQLAELDDIPPVIEVDNKSTSDDYGIDYAVIDNKLTIKGNVNEISEVRINNEPVALSENLSFQKEVTLSEGENIYRIEAADEAGNKAKPKEIKVRYIPDFIELELDNKSETVTKEDSITISGTASTDAEIFVNETTVKTGENNKFSVDYALTGDETDIKVYAKRSDGKVSTEKSVRVAVDKTAPAVSVTNLPSEPVIKKNFKLEGKINEPGYVRINDKDVAVNDDLTFSSYVMVTDAETSFKIQSRDIAGNVSKPEYVTIKRDMSKALDKSKLNLKYKTDDFVYDGDISEWTLDYETDELYWGETDNMAQFGFMWDEEYLYVAVKVSDNVIFTGHPDNTRCDAVEVYIDGNNTKGKSYDAHCKQYVFVAGKETANSISKTTGDGYVTEIAIPWSSVGVTAEQGKEIGVDVNVIDNDNNRSDSGRCGIIGFNGTQNNWLDPSPWSTLTLVK